MLSCYRSTSLLVLGDVMTDHKKQNTCDTVWLLNNFNQPTKAELLAFKGNRACLGFDDGTYRYGAIEKIFKTKQALIEYQIKHWQSLLETDYYQGFGEDADYHSPFVNEECQHESDGQAYIQQYADMSQKTEYFKCKKCVRFYR